MATIEELDQLDSGMEDVEVFVTEDSELNEMRGRRANEQHGMNDVSAIGHKDDLEDYEEDESLAERLLGLTEMFPPEVRKYVYNVGSSLYACTKGLYAFSCSATWLFFSSSAILFAPVLFELERAQVEEAQRTQQKQVLLGPNTAMSSMNAHGLPMTPPVQR